MSKIAKQRGSVIIYTILMISVLLAIALGLTNILVIKARSVMLTQSSATAIFAADSAVELCLYEARQTVNYNEGTSTMNDGTLDNNSTFTIEDLANPGTFVQADCSVLGSGSFSFRAAGSYRGTNRALEISQ